MRLLAEALAGAAVERARGARGRCVSISARHVAVEASASTARELGRLLRALAEALGCQLHTRNTSPRLVVLCCGDALEELRRSDPRSLARLIEALADG